MRPAHPCPICGHPSVPACERTAHDLPLALQERCLGCGCPCRTGRGLVDGPGRFPIGPAGTSLPEGVS